MQNYNRLTINLTAVKANVETLRNHSSPSIRLMPMVKANGYGTDAFTLASFLQQSCNIDIFGVSHIHEGIALREKGFSGSIFVIAITGQEASYISQFDLEVGIDSPDVCWALNAEGLKRKKPIKVHLHVNTGMHRFGCRFDETLSLAEYIHQLPGLEFEGLMTHFVAAESEHSDEITHEQMNLLYQISQDLKKKNISPRWVHSANSAGAIRIQPHFCTLSRIGLALFGLHSSFEEKEILPLFPALSLHSQIIGINHCHHGETVGYLQSYKVKKEREKIAVIPMGYFDGLHLHQSGKGGVIIHGKLAPKVGRICMDFAMVDVTHIPEAKIGDPVLIFGSDSSGCYLSAETVASWSPTNVRELICCLGPRVHREFIYKEILNDKSTEKLCNAVCSF